jgi:hypothetical protein
MALTKDKMISYEGTSHFLYVDNPKTDKVTQTTKAVSLPTLNGLTATIARYGLSCPIHDSPLTLMV